jgi:hypothetical protein
MRRTQQHNKNALEHLARHRERLAAAAQVQALDGVLVVELPHAVAGRQEHVFQILYRCGRRRGSGVSVGVAVAALRPISIREAPVQLD